MPRPGPRPYECVRRAWHSERHHPIRASLVHQLFRLAKELHSPTTRNNHEWQEKLPFVVLKTEEILYSKANSEAEYIDLNTLSDRTNEAIHTIIRKEDNESTETAHQLLYPCIEAALILGCVPRRASRSQRYNHIPGCYLTPNIEPSNSTTPLICNPIISNPSNVVFRTSVTYQGEQNVMEGCDLSLRLGPTLLVTSCSEDLEDVESTSSYA